MHAAATTEYELCQKSGEASVINTVTAALWHTSDLWENIQNRFDKIGTSLYGPGVISYLWNALIETLHRAKTISSRRCARIDLTDWFHLLLSCVLSCFSSAPHLAMRWQTTFISLPLLLPTALLSFIFDFGSSPVDAPSPNVCHSLNIIRILSKGGVIFQ